jgi:DMSO/TMAO reductase YedYZ molybdopterin-dependent catalytic subunit
MLQGFIASAALALISLGARVFLGIPSPLERLYNQLTFWLGTPEMFQLVHRLLGFGQAGKIVALLGSSVLWIGAITLLGFTSSLSASIAVFVVSAMLLAPSAGLVGGVFWALAHAGLYYGIRRALEPVATDASRRGTLRWLGGGAAGALGLGVFSTLQPLLRDSSATSSSGSTNQKSPAQDLPEGIVSQADLYYVSISNEALDPKINEATWKLELTGLVKTPSKFTLQQLKDEFTAKDLEFTMSCISNPIGGNLIGNCIWRGLKVKDLLDKVGIQPGAKWIEWEAADGFYESLPLGQALEEDVILAYFINGEPLNSKHGFPLRVILPGHFGMKQPRWLTKITLSADERLGYWANRGWSRTAYVQPLSRIDEPKEKLESGKPVTLRGIAYAGEEAITKVEVSPDNGQTWLETSLKKRARYAWTRWNLEWTPKKGEQTLIVRCYANGKLQSEKERDSLPEAASGWHKLTLRAT